MAVTLGGVNYILDNLFLRTRNPKDKLWMALTTEDIDPAATGSELYEPAGNYSRVWYNLSPQNWKKIGTTISNSNRILFPRSTSAWGTITNWAVCTEKTGGEVLMEESLEAPYRVGPETQLEIPVGGLVINLDIGGWVL